MTMDFQAGTRIGQYVLDAHVGGGSFGAVWRGHDVGSGQTVAIKLLTGALASSDSIATRADVEVLAAAASRRSPHVVKVLDGGTDPLPYIVMEFIQGKDLQTLLQEQTQLDFEQTVDIGLAISDALQALYEAGIVHRDIKPANVMIDSDGVIKLADFGIAKIVGYETITMAGQAPMTMAYAAPEIWNEDGPFGQPSHKSDLYAMGVLLYQCLTGFTPFRGNYGALYRAHMEQAADISALPPGTPPSLRTLIRRSLEKRQEDRPEDAGECKNILKRAQAEFLSARGDATLNEPRRLGPWLKEAPHESLPWAWRCRHESSGQVATVEVHFSNRLNYSDKLRKAVAVNSKLTPFGAERLIETNRLMLRPNEAWWEPPAGEFQFWVAREDQAVASAERLGEWQLREAVRSLQRLIDAAESEGIALDLGSDNLSVLQNGSIYLRRPGLAEGTADTRSAALAFLRTVPLDAAARDLVTNATSLDELAQRLAESDSGATVIMDTTQLVRTPPPEAQTRVTPVASPAAEVPSAAVPPAPPPPRRPQPSATPAKGPPLAILGGVAAAVLAVAVVAFVLLGGTGDKRAGAGDATAEAGKVAEVEKTDAVHSPVAQPTNSAANLTARPEGREVVDSTILTQNADYDCADGTPGCRAIYSVGPYRFRGNTLRIEFAVQIAAPTGKTINWIDDMTADANMVAQGNEGVQLNGDSGKVWRIVYAGGIAGQSNPNLPPGRYTGYWDFTFEEAVGSTLTFSYPDFEDYITIPVPDRR